MFEPVPDQFTMVDSERGYGFRVVGSTERGEVDIATVTMSEQEIPFEYRVEPRADENGPWYEIALGAFGYSLAGELYYGLGRVAFRSDAERRAAVLVAIEALLVWRPDGLGVERGNGYNRVAFEGRHLLLSDVGSYLGNGEAGESAA